MPAPVEFTITMSALPDGFHGDPQTLADAIVARLTITPSEPWSSFVNGGAEPTSNIGPWLKNGNQWKVWDDGLGAYTDPVVGGSTIVDGTVTLSKIANQTAGSTIIANAFGAISALAPGTAGYVLTMSGGVPTWAAASTPSPFEVYPAQGTSNLAQSFPANDTDVTVVMDSAPINPAPSPINTGTSRYVAPAAGIYMVAVTSQIDADTAVSSSVEVRLSLFKNGSYAGLGDADGTPSPNGGRWSPSLSGLVAMSGGDYLELSISAGDGVGAGNLTLTTFRFSAYRVSA